MLAIRLQRTGRSGHAQFRVIVQDSRFSPKRGRIVSYLGSYNPHTKASTIDSQKASQYMQNGAQPSDSVARLFKKEGIKLPDWVKLDEPKKRDVRNPEKRRSTAPAKPEAEAPPEETAEVPVADAEVEAPAEQTTQAETEAEAPAEPEAEAPAAEQTAEPDKPDTPEPTAEADKTEAPAEEKADKS
jgi:small subunit ribosomal protein S16